MANLINVRRDVSDTFYRYKMEKIQTKIEGKGNGIKTVIPNLSNIASALARDGNIVIKYFGFELGAQTNSNPTDDRWIINGAHEAQKLQESLDGFISKFVLCKKCKNPETEFVFQDDGILLDCKACGVRSAVDVRSKLSGFILKNREKKSKSSKADRKAARRAKQNGSKDADKDGSGSDDRASDMGNDMDGDDDANGSARADSPSATAKDEVVEHRWATDMDPAAVKARQNSLADNHDAKLDANDDDEEGGQGSSTYDQLGDWIQSTAEDVGGDVDKIDDIKIYLKLKELDIQSKHRTVMVLAQTLFDRRITSQIEKRHALFHKLIGTSSKHEKALLGGTERLIASISENNPENYGLIVKVLQLYNHHELVSEEVARYWCKHASKKYVDIATSKKIRKCTEPFVKWLDEAESEEDEDEDEDDNEDEDEDEDDE